MLVDCVSRMSTHVGLLRRATKLAPTRRCAPTLKKKCRLVWSSTCSWLHSRLRDVPPGVALLISAGAPALTSSCESAQIPAVPRGVMHQFQDLYKDKEIDETAIEKENLALREEILGHSSAFKHPYLSRPWYWRFIYKLSRCVYLAVLWTPAALLFPVTQFIGNDALRGLWLDLMVWTIEMSGCTFVKLAQWCSMRPDMFTMDVIDRIKVLQQYNASHSMSHTRCEIRESFGHELEEFFSEFDPVPIASGSIAQVHRARLRSNGQQVAVKVRHPNVLRQSFVDTELISLFLDATNMAVIPFDREGYYQHMCKQIDLTVESQNLRLFRANFAREIRSGTIVFPESVEGLVSSTVLVETWCPGREVSNFFFDGWTPEGIDMTQMSALNQAELERNMDIARALFDVYMKMFLRDNYIHGDLHGGNILYHGQDGEGHPGANTKAPGADQLSIIDVGLTTSLSRDVETGFASFLYALLKGNADGLVDQIIEYNENKSSLQSPAVVQEFRTQVRQLLAQEIRPGGMRAPNGDPISPGNIVGAVMRTMSAYKICMHRDFASALMTLSVGEGLIRQLDPSFDVVAEAAPYFAHYAGSGMLREFTVSKMVQSSWQSMSLALRDRISSFARGNDNDTDTKAVGWRDPTPKGLEKQLTVA